METIKAYLSGGGDWTDAMKKGIILDEVAKMTYQRVYSAVRPLFGSSVDPKSSSLDKETFGHQVVSHAFMEFLGISGVQGYTKRDKESLDDKGNLRKIYDRFAEVNNIPENLREVGWKEFKED